METNETVKPHRDKLWFGLAALMLLLFLCHCYILLVASAWSTKPFFEFWDTWLYIRTILLILCPLLFWIGYRFHLYKGKWRWLMKIIALIPIAIWIVMFVRGY